jgi:FtsZ-binding cell division protein ZapB
MKPTVFNCADYVLLQEEFDLLKAKENGILEANAELARQNALLRVELEKVKTERDQYKAALQNWHEDDGWGGK